MSEFVKCPGCPDEFGCGRIYRCPDAPSEHALPESTGPAPVVGSGGGVGPLSREEVLILKIAEHDLHRTAMIAAVRKLLHGARKAGTSQHQCLILRVHLEELCQRADAAEEVKWPNNQISNAGTKND